MAAATPRSSSVKTQLLSSPSPLMGKGKISSIISTSKTFNNIPRILAKAKTSIIQVANNIHVDVVYTIISRDDLSASTRNRNKNKKKLKKFLMNYSCCSTHSQIMPVVPPPVIKRSLPNKKKDHHQYYYDHSSWNSSGDDDEAREDGLSGYLNWLEGKKMAAAAATVGKTNHHHHHHQKKEYYSVSGGHDKEDDDNEIDRLAEMFIAKSYEKFRVERDESYRRFQDMLARSL